MEYIKKAGKKVEGRLVSYENDVINFVDQMGNMHVTHVHNYQPRNQKQKNENRQYANHS